MFFRTAGKSGFGDGGAQAIRDFRKQHQCNMLCEKLNFQQLDELEDLRESPALLSSDIDADGDQDDDEQNLLQGEGSTSHSSPNSNSIRNF
jgi:hypothetical protein